MLSGLKCTYWTRAAVDYLASSSSANYSSYPKKTEMKSHLLFLLCLILNEIFWAFYLKGNQVHDLIENGERNGQRILEIKIHWVMYDY